MIDLTDKNKTMFDMSNLKILGALRFVGRELADWKIIAINALDAREENIRDLADFKSLHPGAFQE